MYRIINKIDRAKSATFDTVDGVIETPCFMNVGTAAAIKGAVSTEDYMTANYIHLPYRLIDEASRRIVNEVKGVNRVLYDCTSKPPATIEFE